MLHYSPYARLDERRAVRSRLHDFAQPALVGRPIAKYFLEVIGLGRNRCAEHRVGEEPLAGEKIGRQRESESAVKFEAKRLGKVEVAILDGRGKSRLPGSALEQANPDCRPVDALGAFDAT
jgi:hypothetical protein